jgi:ferrous iron transport protein B
MDREVFPLTLFKEGEEGFVYLLSGGEGFTSRLAGMGIIAGTRIKVLRNTGGQVIVLASDTRIAFGKNQADKILVVKSITAEYTEENRKAEKRYLVTLAGQPNVGKTTVFNLLTGLSQHVGNWPGKTVEIKEGLYELQNVEIKFVDLPGTYSLSAFSDEERVARDFIIHEHPDVIVLIVNASALERSLYLLTEILLLKTPVIVGVNMIDMAESQGMHIDTKALQEALGLPVIEMVATKNKGVKELVAEIIRLAENQSNYNPKMPEVSDDHKDIYIKLEELVDGHVPLPYTKAWVAVKLMEGDREITEAMKDIIPPLVWDQIKSLLIKHEDALRAVLGGRYDWIEEVTRAAVSRFKRGQVLMTDRIDHVLARPASGIPILLATLALVFTATFAIGYPLQGLLETLTGFLGRWVDSGLSNEPWWVRGILVNGVIGGVGSVLTFIPLLVIFYFSMTFLENVGYMARAAFVMDRFMHIIGLHGKSFMPMCLGFGCNVPSILGARIIESERARLLTIFLTPFVPCTGRLAVLTFVAAAVFGKQGMIVSWLLVTMNIIMLGLAGMIISKFFFRDEPVPFIMELPLYHKPDFKTIGIIVWTRTVAFIKKAGSIILVFSVLLWIMSNVPGGGIEQSMLARIGRILEPVGAPIGLDWKMMVALLSSIIAKENSVATLGVLYGAGEEGLMTVLPQVVNHATAASFLVMLMLFIPCVPTITVMKQEMGKLKWSLASLFFMLIISYIGAAIAYRLVLSLGL